MNVPFVVPFYAGIFALIYIFLGMRASRLRTGANTMIGHGNDPRLERAIRAHGNFGEYVPFILLMLGFAEFPAAPLVALPAARALPGAAPRPPRPRLWHFADGREGGLSHLRHHPDDHRHDHRRRHADLRILPGVADGVIRGPMDRLREAAEDMAIVSREVTTC